jgi:[protein-PII] uridylyltransferase
LSKRKLPQVATAVTFDVEGSDHYTLIEVSTQDGIGVLFAITHTLYRLGCLIHLAKISTVLHHVYDVFYVSDSEGRKITDHEQLRDVAEAVRARLEEHAASTRPSNASAEITF